ncbi:MAG TPA: hypothetical protein VN656_04425, partial [Stellaceae bacterium]|nr:hypothetical protein [Stellaceae bacterium]
MMSNIAIFARESVRRDALAAVAHASGVFIDSVSDVSALQRLLDRHAIDVVLAEGLSAEDFGALGD